ncbi:hypothetical protein [Nostoc sp.]|uniref:hypothetical protein n=1 Tax=Nostoc sp. TaxID=1180 RepID=UPI002FF523A3
MQSVSLSWKKGACRSDRQMTYSNSPCNYSASFTESAVLPIPPIPSSTTRRVR